MLGTRKFESFMVAVSRTRFDPATVSSCGSPSHPYSSMNHSTVWDWASINTPRPSYLFRSMRWPLKSEKKAVLESDFARSFEENRPGRCKASPELRTLWPYECMSHESTDTLTRIDCKASMADRVVGNDLNQFISKDGPDLFGRGSGSLPGLVWTCFCETRLPLDRCFCWGSIS